MFSITSTAKHISVVSPFHSAFIHEAKANLAGRWQDGAWTFDIRNADAVRALVKKWFGYTEGCDLVSLRVGFDEDGAANCRGPVYRAGRVVASAHDRDGGARLGDGVILESGGVTSGGSTNNWQTVVRPNTVVVIHDVPRAIAEKHADPEGDGGYQGETYEIIVPAAAALSGRDALAAEREKLLARLAEIDTALAPAKVA